MDIFLQYLPNILWVIFVFLLFYRYEETIENILLAFQKRVEKGSNIKIGGFELFDQINVQESSGLLIKLNEEKLEFSEIQKKESEISEQTSENREKNSEIEKLFQEKYLQAEDLALRALQEEYEEIINRQLSFGSNIGIDGAFVRNGRLNVIEVKYAYRYINLEKYYSSINQIVQFINNYSWKNVQIILAIVVDDERDKILSARLANDFTEKFNVNIVIRLFSMSELKNKYYK